MPLFALKSLSKSCALEDPAAGYKLAHRVEQFRLGEDAIYFPAFPGNQYLPFSALTHVICRNTAISVKGTCGKQLPMVRVRLTYDGEFYKDFLFEKQKSATHVLDLIRANRPEVPVDLDLRPFGS